MTIPSQVLCTKCGVNAPRIKSSWCNECQNAYARQWRKEHPEEHKSYYTQWRKINRPKLKVQAMDRRKNKIASMNPEELKAFRNFESAKSKRLNDVLKDEVFKAYGGWKCACCGESERAFLSIDHINNDGGKMRKEGTHGKASTCFYRFLKKNNFPKGFQVLCMNCNFGKRMNGNVCPHQERCNDYREIGYSQVAGSATHPKGDEIVCSAWKHAAVEKTNMALRTMLNMKAYIRN